MSSKNKIREKDKASKRTKERNEIIKYIFKEYGISDKELSPDQISIFHREKIICISEAHKIFTNLEELEIAYILNIFIFAQDNSVINIINFLDTINTILCHYDYYDKNLHIKYNNSHFDNYLIKRYESAYYFSDYLITESRRELKIDNKLYFNYFPITCKRKEHKEIELSQKVGQSELEECHYAHNKMEEQYHPFVYKKFKCHKNGCKNENCPFYHVDKNGEAEDMETEVDFDSNEIINLQQVLSSLNMNKEDIKKNEKLDIFLQKKAKDTGDYIPSEFNPKTYKIYKCPLGPICKLDKKLCLNYHGNTDKRRNPYFYDAVLCPNLYEDNKKIPNAKCDEGDNCSHAHNLYEYYYHPDKFRTIKCPNEKKKNSYCKERLICPYRHKTDSCENDENILINEKLITNYYLSKIISYSNSIKSEENKLKEIKKKYCCYLCGKSSTNILQCNNFLIDCSGKKIICSKCANKNGNIKTREISW